MPPNTNPESREYTAPPDVSTFQREDSSPLLNEAAQRSEAARPEAAQRSDAGAETTRLPRTLTRIAKAGAMVLSAAAVAAGSAPETADASQAQRLQTSRNIATALARTQQPSGHLYDQFGPRGASRYGDAVGGLGLLQTGLRDHNNKFIRVGIKATNNTTRHSKTEPWSATRPFKVKAVAESYNALDESAVKNRPMAKKAMKQWGSWLKKQKTTYMGRNGYENKYLLDAGAVLETQKTGLKSKARGTILGSGRKSARRHALNLINRKIPAMASSFALSDPADHNPIAYASLSLGEYGQAVKGLKGRATKRNRGMLRELAETAEQMAGPDGDIAYWGRSAEQPWTLSFAANGLAIAAGQKGTSPARRQRYLAQADRLTNHLATYNPNAAGTTPAFSQDPVAAKKSLEGYERTSEYWGLALNGLNEASSNMRNSPTSQNAVLADKPGGRVINQGTGRFATVTSPHGNLWYAVREQGLGNLPYDFGAVAFKKRNENGAWKDVTPQRPHASGTAGPALVTGNGITFPVGRRITAGRDGGVYITGDFRRGPVMARPNVNFNVKPVKANPADPVETCLKTTVETVRPGDRYQFTAFFRGNENPVSGQNGTLYGKDGQVVSFEGGTATPQPPEQGLASPTDAHITRQPVIVQADGDKPVSMVNC